MSTLLAAASTAAQNSLAVDILSGAVAGGTAILPFQEIGDMGAIGIFADPAGAAR